MEQAITKLFARIEAWREARKMRASRERLTRPSRVLLPKPDPRCQRNSVEAVP
jgi:hypothetical protein